MAQQSPRRRRSLSFSFLNRVTVAAENLPASPGLALRQGAQTWASEQQLVLGTWSSPREMPDDSFRVTARCHRHESCYNNEGRLYEFKGTVSDQILQFSVSTHGDCAGEERIARARPSGPLEDQLTKYEIAQVNKAADELLEKGLSASTAAVKIRLRKDKLDLPAQGIRSILKARNQKLANGTTKKFSESESQFEAFVGSLDTDKLCVKFMQYTPYFAYVALLMSFFDKMVQMNPERIYICSDFAFKVEVMNYSYGVICTSGVQRHDCVFHFCFGPTIIAMQSKPSKFKPLTHPCKL